MLEQALHKLLRVLTKLWLVTVVRGTLQRLGLLKIAYGAYERLIAFEFRGAQSRTVTVPADGLPLPPSDLIFLVAGSPNIDWYLQSGKSTFEVVINTLRNNGVCVETLGAVLEFGCGCGRILRHWHSVHGPKIHGVDYNARLINWCRQNLPFEFAINNLHPPLLYADGVFDCVYAISVFTHMSEELHLSWLNELRRIIRPGGYLILTTHGESSQDRLTRREREAFNSGQLVVKYAGASGTNLCNSYHPEAYVRQRMSAGYAIEDFIPAGTPGGFYQDLYMMRKKTDSEENHRRL